MEEIWKDIPGLALYQASNKGNIRNKETKKVLHQYINTNNMGHKDLRLRLYNNKIAKTYKVHRLIAMTFLENYSNDLTVDHLNTDTTDNNVSNLRMATMKENMNNPLTRELCRITHLKTN